MPETPTSILARFVAQRRLDPSSRVETMGPQDVVIVYLRAEQLRCTHGRAFLAALVQNGWRVHLRLPLRAALPFWQRMRAAGLVMEDPDQLQTWEDYLDGIENQMADADADVSD